MSKQLKLEIVVKEVDVTEDWYEIYYIYRINGKKWIDDLTDGDYENGDTPKQWKKTLEDGLAMQYALEKVIEEIDF